MRTRRSLASGLVVVIAGLALSPTDTTAHKAITSPYTFTEHVLPIVRERCGRCHTAGGVAPMSLLTHREAVPWAESIRMELIAGHMPPWPVDAPNTRFQHANTLTARESNVILTWASGGTPAGAETGVASDALVPAARPWTLGNPDLILPLPEFTLDAATQETTAEVTLPTGTTEARWVRAVDLNPGTPAMVRSARITIVSPGALASPALTMPETQLGIWAAGDTPVALPAGAAFHLPAGASLTVRIQYKKTWEHERAELRDRSAIGLYLATGLPSELRVLHLATPVTTSTKTPSTTDTRTPITFAVDLDRDAQLLAIYPESALANVTATIDAIRQDGSRTELISLRPQRGWLRRYWLREPILLSKGTRLVVRARPFADSPLTSTLLPALTPIDRSTVRLALNVLPIAP